LALNALPNVNMAVQQITIPVNRTITLARRNHGAPPNKGAVTTALSHSQPVIAVVITIHKISIEPRSRTLPLPPRVRVPTATITSEANQMQQSTRKSNDIVMGTVMVI
jgi:hypothetical protein